MNVTVPGRKVMLVTLGCKINQYDTNAMASSLKREGHRIVRLPSEADVIVINTCTVTGRTDYKGRQLIRRAVHQNPAALIIVTGCYAQVQAERIAEISGVDYVLGNGEKPRIASWVSRGEKQPVPTVHAGGILQARPLGHESADVHSGTTRAFLKIQDGCDQGCSYCIIPRARGRSRSLPLSQAKERIGVLVEKGFQEVVLCGIHLGVYGQDLQPPASLLDLLVDLERDAGIPRIRISSIEPNELTDGLLDLFASSSRLCPHFHLPLQSGDPEILKAMHRPYGPGDFRRLVERIDQGLPDAAIGVDLIAGFPGEGEESFRNTVRLLEALRISYFHVFPFSPRPGTAAARLPDPVPAERVEKMASALRRMGMQKRIAYHHRFVGTEQEVLVEGKRDSKTGMLKGLTRNYIPVLLEGSESLKGRCIRVEIRDLRGKEVFGVATQGSLQAVPPAAGHLDNCQGCDKIKSLVNEREKHPGISIVRE